MKTNYKKIINKFRKRFSKTIEGGRYLLNDPIELEKFLLTQLTLAEKKIAEDICLLIDTIELSYKDTSLEEWKAFKGIRNAIRDRYVLKQDTQNK